MRARFFSTVRQEFLVDFPNLNALRTPETSPLIGQGLQRLIIDFVEYDVHAKKDNELL